MDFFFHLYEFSTTESKDVQANATLKSKLNKGSKLDNIN